MHVDPLGLSLSLQLGLRRTCSGHAELKHVIMRLACSHAQSSRWLDAAIRDAGERSGYR